MNGLHVFFICFFLNFLNSQVHIFTEFTTSFKLLFKVKIAITQLLIMLKQLRNDGVSPCPLTIN